MATPQREAATTREVIAGRYLVVDEVASGGMATVYLGRLLGPAGFSKIVAIKRLHRHLAKEPEFVAMFLDEARLAVGVRHANVVSTLDVVSDGAEIVLVMEYILGESLSTLLRAAKKGAPVDIAVAITTALLEGLHAAHEARSETGQPLDIVHRDVSPQNVLIGADGVARVVDFGIAKAIGRAQLTRDGQVKGKASYMPPEQAWGEPLDRRADIYSAGVVLWELLTGRRLFVGDDPVAIAMRVINEEPPPPSRFAADVPPALDAIVLRALAKKPHARYPTAHAFADALEQTVPAATVRSVARWVDDVAHDLIEARARAMNAALAADESGATPASAAPTSGSATRVQDAPDNTVDTTGVRRVLAMRGPRVWAAIAGIATAVAIAMIAKSLLTSPTRSEEAVAPATAQTAVDPPIASAVMAAPSESVAPAESAAVDLDETAAQAKPAAPVASVRRAPRPAASTSCNPPWTLDADGIRVLKPQCR